MHTTTTVRIGLVLAALLGLGDVASIGALGGDGPPAVVIFLGVALGVVTLAAIRPAWRGSRSSAIAIVVARVISALTAVPAFFVDDVPAGFVAAAAVSIVVTAATVVLVTPALTTRRLAAS
jgi:hypothetical protein